MNSKLKHSEFFKSYMKPAVSNNLIFSSQYKTTSFDSSKNESRYYAPANIEWKNNSYSYNKNMVDMPFHQRFSSVILRNYFNLDFNYKTIKNLKRLPLYKLLKLSPKNYFSLPKIKDSLNKTIVTLYIYNRERKYIDNEFFFMKKSYRQGKLRHSTVLPNRSLRVLNKNKRLSYLRKDYNRYLLEAFTRDAKKFTQFLLNKRLIFRTLLIHRFLKWALSTLKIKVLIIRKKTANNVSISANNCIKEIKLIRGRHFDAYVFRKPMITNLRTLNYINVILIRYLKEFYSKGDNIKLLYDVFRDKCYDKIKDTYFRNEFLSLNYLLGLRMQINKYHSYIPVLKMFLRKIINKKIEINIVDLKYLYMNSDIYSKASSLVLEKKRPTLQSLRKFNRLIRMQRLHNNKFAINYKNVFTKRINFDCETNNKYKDVLHKTVQNMFRRNLANNLDNINQFKSTCSASWQTNIDHVLNYLKHKWVTGVRLQAKGRLSRRYGATRSNYMELYKGNLRIMQHITDPDIKQDNDKLRKLPSVALVRGRSTSNLQYSYVSSKVRTGAFGVKGWISSN